jgi:uncharacterized OB-fold protein
VTFEGVDGPFWEAAQEGRLVVQRCERCGAGWWPAIERCGDCDGGDLVWSQVAPEGSVWSYAVYHRVFDPRLDVQLPYAVAAVELASGVCLPGRVVGPLEGLQVGAAVDAEFVPLDGDVLGPAWRLRAGDSR